MKLLRTVRKRSTAPAAALGLATALFVGGDAFVPSVPPMILGLCEQTSHVLDFSRTCGPRAGLLSVEGRRFSHRVAERRHRGRDDREGGRNSITIARETTLVLCATPAAAAAASIAVENASAAGSAVAAVAATSSAAPLLGSLSVLAAVIALHEAGHLVAALSQGIKVNAFSIGFGPRLLSYRRGGSGVSKDGGGGGAGLLSGTILGPSWDWGSGGEEKHRREQQRQLEARKSGEERGAGIKKGQSVRKGKPATAAGGGKKVALLTSEDIGNEGVEYTLRAIPMGGFVSFPNNYEVDQDGVVTEFDDPDLLSNRGPASRAIVVAAGVVANLMVAWACIFGVVLTTGIVQPRFSRGVVLQEITDSKGGASLAGFRPNDVFLSINGNPLEIGDNRNLEKAVRAIRTSGGNPIQVEVARDGAESSLVRTVKTALTSDGKYSIGVRLSPNLEAVERRKAASPIEAAKIALGETAGIAGKTLDAFVHLASTGDTEGVSGPVEIVKVGAQVATEDGASALLQFAAVISVNLAVINSLPVPGLDGGQMVFVLAELISRRKLERGVTETINGVALLILLAISLSTLAGDLGIGGLLQRVLSGAVR